MNATMIGGLLLSVGVLFSQVFSPPISGQTELRGWSAKRVIVVGIEHRNSPETTTTTTTIVFRHGDISWLPVLAAEAGWPEDTWDRLGEIILRESGGCPNRRGGDVVDQNCRIVRVSEWNHRSDTGLLQINGVNYDPHRNRWARICSDMDICRQEPLLDPATNLRAGYLLYGYSGWDPWDPCTYGPKWANRCKSSRKP